MASIETSAIAEKMDELMKTGGSSAIVAMDNHGCMCS